jgi:hypothetical protein
MWCSFFVNIWCKISILLSKNTNLKIQDRNFVCFWFWCQTRSLTFREERRLMFFENWVLRKIFLPKSDELTGEWGRSHNEECYDLYSSPNIIGAIKSKMIWAGQVAITGDRRGTCRALVGKPEGERPLGRTTLRCVDNIKNWYSRTVMGAWTGFIWLIIVTGGLRLWMR